VTILLILYIVYIITYFLIVKRWIANEMSIWTGRQNRVVLISVRFHQCEKYLKN
jgi:hypothetical protein